MLLLESGFAHHGMRQMVSKSCGLSGAYYFTVVSYVYFSRFNYTRPLTTALVFVGFVMIVDFLVVALLINRSLAMFGSLLGTWIPFALIFVSSLVTGKLSASR